MRKTLLAILIVPFFGHWVQDIVSQFKKPVLLSQTEAQEAQSILEESSNPEESSSEYWWLNSGGKFFLYGDGLGWGGVSGSISFLTSFC